MKVALWLSFVAGFPLFFLAWGSTWAMIAVALFILLIHWRLATLETSS